MIKLYVIEETTRMGFKGLCKNHMEMGSILLFETKKEADGWRDVLDKARGQQSDKDIIRSKFRTVKLVDASKAH
jgi:hypothetical protein